MHARQRAEELRIAIQEACVRDGETAIPLTASFGVASGFPPSHEELIREADEALYRAKNSGRNCVVATEIDARRTIDATRRLIPTSRLTATGRWRARLRRLRD